ncbi:MAG: hypothetical protein KKE79_06640 [Actinobacteria bacterium]|nr:hypothetical protein [Actinomycetota bacterium]MBU4490298.1 hypothetical protein [Actinomycetota bacterium]
MSNAITGIVLGLLFLFVILVFPSIRKIGATQFGLVTSASASRSSPRTTRSRSRGEAGY